MTLEVFAFDLVTGDSLGRLNVGAVVWSEQLNARMTLDCRLDLAHRPSAEMVPKLIDQTVNAVRPVKLVIYDDVNVAKPVTKSFILREATYSARRWLNLRCAGLWSWFAQFPLTSTLSFTDVDQHEIAATLIDWAQASAQGDGIGVATNGVQPSGRLRTRTYNGFESAPVGQRVDELASVSDGFEFAIVTEFDGNVTVTETWLPSYPFAGTKWPDSKVQVDADAAGLGFEVDWVQPTTNLREIGAGEGESMLTATASDPTLSDWPPLWHVAEARKSVSRAETLQGHASRDLQLVNRGNETWAPNLIDRFGSLKSLTVGDECQVVIGTGDHLWPNGLEVVRRVIGRTITVPDAGGPDRVQLELEESDVQGGA